MSNIEISGSGKKFEVDDKRFYVPGVVLKSTCPECQAPASRDMGDDYLSYPKANTPIDSRSFHCECCDHEWSAKIVLSITVEDASMPSPADAAAAAHERLAQHRQNLEGWKEPDGAFVPTEPDLEERERVRVELRATIHELETILGEQCGGQEAPPS